MNGPHDMGGMHGFGRVQPEVNEPVFHADWEKTVLAASGAVRSRGLVNIDEFRHAIERMPPAEYLNTPLLRPLAERPRTLARREGHPHRPGGSRARGSTSGAPGRPAVRRVRSPRSPSSRQHRPNPRAAYERPGPAPRYSLGERVRARNVHPTGHTRLPRYARGKRGTINQVRGVYVFPDTHAHGLGEQPQPLYTVQFDGRGVVGRLDRTARGRLPRPLGELPRTRP